MDEYALRELLRVLLPELGQGPDLAPPTAEGDEPLERFVAAAQAADVAFVRREATVLELDRLPDADGYFSFGVRASTSLLLWSERGKAAAEGAKLESASLGAADALRRVGAAARTAAASLQAARAALAVQAVAVAQARRLLEAEQQRFEAGESSLFLLIQRERTLLDESARLADTEAKAVAARAALAVALGFPAVLPES